jgi:hypothetical protein
MRNGRIAIAQHSRPCGMPDENCSTEAPKKPTKPAKISAAEKTAVRIMRKVYEATGRRPQRWESVGNSGAVKADAAGIA